MPVDRWGDFLANGVKVDEGQPIPARKEYRSLSEIEKELFKEGMKRFQTKSREDQLEPLSYFQIAGIHGRPYTTWPNLEWNKDQIPKRTPKPNPDGSDGGWDGFCTHSSILFLTWHRPYLALFESQLHEHVKKWVEESGKGPEYTKAAKSFRLPYWDWAKKGRSVFPEDALRDSPNSTNEENPLHHYTFATGTPVEIAYPWLAKDVNVALVTDKPTPTARWPGQPDAETKLAERMKVYQDTLDKSIPGPPPSDVNPVKNLTERVSYVLLSYERFGSMTRNIWREEDKQKGRVDHSEDWGSMEDIHNAVHVLVGNNGHMHHQSASAFDPIFWMHHANIDRLWALWQTLHNDDTNEDTFVTARKARTGTFSYNPGEEETKFTPLYPFRRLATGKGDNREVPEDQQEVWHTSETAKLPESFGYTYPEIAGFHKVPTEFEKRELREWIFKNYASLAWLVLQSKRGVPDAALNLLPQAYVLEEIARSGKKATAAVYADLVAKMPLPADLLKRFQNKPPVHALAPDNTYLEWLVNIKGEKHAFDGLYTVHIFLGPVEEEDVALWPSSPNHVALFAPFGNPPTTGCGKCKDDQEHRLEVTGQIPLTLALTERYLATPEFLENLTPEKVMPYLAKNLHWRVALPDNTQLGQRSAVDGLTVAVVSNKVTLFPADDTVKYDRVKYDENVLVWPQATTKEDGAHGRGEGTGVTPDEVPKNMRGEVPV